MLLRQLRKLWLFRPTFYISDNNLQELCQFATLSYKPYHSTESALVKVYDDSLRPLDNLNSVILLLLDLSEASDTVDHNILLSRSKPRFGINGISLHWFRSYLSNRTYTVTVLGGRSTERPLMTGVPQGSVLEPILSSMYTSPLGDVISLHDLSYHLYEDDTQLYVTFKTTCPDDMHVAESRIDACKTDVGAWMAYNKLKLNSSKTELLVLNARHRFQLPLEGLLLCGDHTLRLYYKSFYL